MDERRREYLVEVRVSEELGENLGVGGPADPEEDFDGVLEHEDAV